MRFRILPVALLLLFSCRTVDVITRIQREDAEAVWLANDKKTVLYIPMHHIGKPQFYNGVRILVDSFKKQGFTVFYESAKMEEIDSAQKDLYDRKFRKMLGLHIDTTGYVSLFQQKGLFKYLVDQPGYSELGVDSTDILIDIPKNRLVDRYEEIYGEIELEKGDMVPLDARYNMELRLPKKEVMSVIIDERNRNLALAIQFSDFNRIIVIYGAAHLGGTLQELKKFDRSWTKRN